MLHAVAGNRGDLRIGAAVLGEHGNSGAAQDALSVIVTTTEADEIALAATKDREP
jgi:hypothetical protein